MILKLKSCLKQPPTSRGRCVPGAFDLEEDGVGVVGKQEPSDQTEHLRNNKPSTGIKDTSVNAEETITHLKRSVISLKAA